MKKISLFLITIAITALTSSAVFAQHWVKRVNGTGNGMDAITSMVLDDAGNVYVTGYSASPSNDLDYLTIKYNSGGDKQWSARYNGPGNGSDIPNSIFVDH